MTPPPDQSTSVPLPEGLEPLDRLARNLAWTWDPQIASVLAEVDPGGLEAASGNPVGMLAGASPARLAELAADEGGFRARLSSAVARLDDRLAVPGWIRAGAHHLQWYQRYALTGVAGDADRQRTRRLRPEDILTGRPRPQAGRCRAGTRQHHDPLGMSPRGAQPGKPGREGLAAPRAGRADHQHRPGPVLDHPSLGVREPHPEAGGVSLHRPNASDLGKHHRRAGVARARHGTL